LEKQRVGLNFESPREDTHVYITRESGHRAAGLFFYVVALFGNKPTSRAFGLRWSDGQRKDLDMTRLLAFTALALSMGIAPVSAADTPTQPPTANTTSPEASKSATVPPSGKADTSAGAKEQSSSPPSAGSTMGKMGAQGSPSGGQTTSNPSGKMRAQSSTSGGQTPNPAAPGSND
jgi:hypothetical protein